MTIATHPRTGRRYLAASAATAITVGLLLAGCGSDETEPQSDAPAAPSIDIHRAPDIASWTTAGSIAVPLGAVDGPTSSPGAPFAGYTQTPQGAALAAIDQSVQLATAVDGRWAEILPAVSVAGPGRDLWAGNRALVSTSGIDPSVAPEIVGYTIEEYSADAADVSIVQRFPDDSLASTLTPVTWSGDDWKLTLPVSDTNPVEDLAALPGDIVDLEGTRP